MFTNNEEEEIKAKVNEEDEDEDELDQFTLEELIEIYENEMEWDDVSLKINITQYNDEFLTKYKDWLHWDIISQNQYMNKDFIEKWKEFLHMEDVKNNERIPQKEKEPFFDFNSSLQ